MASVEISMKVYLDERAAEIMVKSIKPELSSMKTGRSLVEIIPDKGCLNIVLTSKDIVAARAASNTVIRLLKASYETLEVVEDVE
ncbi:MAG: KEOPS complex subunit Pcc1 [Candidatus Caldarchaeum sp.]|nr:KEOPS complex subunit Pcc1 [Candidatus Caldarchaeum sp.]